MDDPHGPSRPTTVQVLPALVVHSAAGTHRVRHGQVCRIGRDPASDVVGDDPRVSWRHAEVRVEGGRWVLVDLDSRNGVFADGRRTSRLVITAAVEVRLADPEDGPALRCSLEQVRARPSPRPPAAQQTVRSAPPPTEKIRPDALAVAPRVDVAPTRTVVLSGAATTIGRADDNDLVLPELEISRHHARLYRTEQGRFELEDLGSSNGTYVNGQRIAVHPVSEHDIIGMGHSTFRLKDGQLRQFVDEGEISIKAHELTVRVGHGKVLLDRVSFPIPEKCLVGVIGPSGAGKSTLVGALTGLRPADDGSVLYDNRDLYRNYDELRYRIGFVPQQNILHLQLTARRALRYAAELRFPADTTAPERDARVGDVLSELALGPHADTRADRLSGGQLKRVNVALELLTKPSMLVLDEPTSGLDPGLDKTIMEQLRDLAHDARTVVVVTHSVANLHTCDRLLVLAPGGRLAFYGPPEEALPYFALPGWAELFQAFEREPDRAWGAEFEASAARARWAQVPAPADSAQANPGQADANPVQVEAPPARRSRLRQTSTLARRYARVIASDRGYLLFLGLLPVVLGLLLHFVPAKEGLVGAPGTNLTAQELLQIMVTCACLAGTACSVREIVKERPIYTRERAAGLSAGAYVLSKLLVLGAVSVLQAIVIVLFGMAGRTLPLRGAWLGLPLVELLIAIALLALASMCLGLLVSALIGTSEKAMPILVMVTMAQIILSGGVLPLAGLAGLSQLAWIAPSRWGFGATATTVDLNRIGHNETDPLWQPTAQDWLRDVGVVVLLAALCLLVAWLRLRRYRPHTRHRGADRVTARAPRR